MIFAALQHQQCRWLEAGMKAEKHLALNYTATGSCLASCSEHVAHSCADRDVCQAAYLPQHNILKEYDTMFANISLACFQRQHSVIAHSKQCKHAMNTTFPWTYQSINKDSSPRTKYMTYYKRKTGRFQTSHQVNWPIGKSSIRVFFKKSLKVLHSLKRLYCNLD